MYAAAKIACSPLMRIAQKHRSEADEHKEEEKGRLKKFIYPVPDNCLGL